ncbi:ricin B lectin domain-containing protein [Xylariaceae sp. FL0016]|nr:ricin B lectin domain-containing protein [Xylariaceae sp. FL0016]
MDNRQDYFLPDHWHGRTVKFINCASNNAMDLNGGSSADGTKIQGWEQNGSTPQQWVLEKVTPGAAWSPWKIRNVCGGSYMDLLNGSNEMGTSINGFNNGGGNKNAQWFIISQEQSENTWFWLQNAAAFTYADCDGAHPENGTKVHGWQRGDGNRNQMWRIIPV